MTGQQEERQRILRQTILAVAVIAFLLPLLWTALAAFGLVANNNTSPPSIRGTFTLDNFVEVSVAEPSFWPELITTITAAISAAVLTTVVSVLAAYGLARSRFRGDHLFTQGLVVLASLPAMAYVIPLSDLLRRAHLIDSFAALVVVEAAVTTPLAIYVLHGAIQQLPSEWEEAALLDGAGLLRVIARVVLPLIGPSVAATAIVVFVLDWNLLLVPLVITGGELKTIPVGMMDFFTFERELEWPTAAAALIISLAPVAILILAFHRVLDGFSLIGSIEA